MSRNNLQAAVGDDHAGNQPSIAPSRWLPRNAFFVLGTVVLLCAWFQALRLGLMFRNAESLRDVGWSQWLSPFWVGLRFDIAAACFAVAPLVALIHIPGLNPTYHRRGRHVAFVYLLLLLGAGSYALLAEYEFFREFQVRYNGLAFQYLDQPGTVIGMVWNGYPVIRYTLVWVVIVAVTATASRWWINRVYRHPSPPPRLTALLLVQEVVTILVVSGGLAIGMRGGLQHEPLRWGNAFVSDNDAVNQFSLNGLYSLGRAAIDHFSRHSAGDAWSHRMLRDDATAAARSMILNADDHLVAPGNSTMLRTGYDRSPRWLSLKPGVTRPNVVIVIMESFSARMSRSVSGGYKGECFTPEFDRVAADGVLFTRAFSVGTHTHQGVFGTMLSFPNLPGYEALMQSAAANQNFTSLPSIFEAMGYQTLFLYNGDFSWDNMRGFFQKQGINRFIGRNDFPSFSATDKVWGVNDEQVLRRANEEFEQAAEKGPFFALVLTLSNHSPFLLPDPLPFTPTSGHGELDTRLNAVRYADWAFGRFIDEARTRQYFKNTLFVFVGDHGFSLPPKLTPGDLIYHHVPLLVYGPGVLDGGASRQDFAVSQLNIAPSILGLLKVNAPHAFWARDVLTESGRRDNFAIFKSSSGDNVITMVRGDHVLVLDSLGTPRLYRYTFGERPDAVELTDAASIAERDRWSRGLLGFVQSAIVDLRNMRAGVDR